MMTVPVGFMGLGLDVLDYLYSLISLSQIQYPYEGEIKTMMSGGGKHLLYENIELSSNLGDSQKDVITGEVRDLRKEISELKEMIKLLIQNK